jgi:hypothetical protein
MFHHFPFLSKSLRNGLGIEANDYRQYLSEIDLLNQKFTKLQSQLKTNLQINPLKIYLQWRDLLNLEQKLSPVGLKVATKVANDQLNCININVNLAI